MLWTNMNSTLNYTTQTKSEEVIRVGESHLIQMSILGLEIYMVLIEIGGKWTIRGYMSEQYAREYLLRKYKMLQIQVTKLTGDASEYASYLQRGD